jgi:hypothetical protein
MELAQNYSQECTRILENWKDFQVFFLKESYLFNHNHRRNAIILADLTQNDLTYIKNRQNLSKRAKVMFEIIRAADKLHTSGILMLLHDQNLSVRYVDSLSKHSKRTPFNPRTTQKTPRLSYSNNNSASTSYSNSSTLSLDSFTMSLNSFTTTHSAR